MRPGLRSFAVGPSNVTRRVIGSVPVAIYTLDGAASTGAHERPNDVLGTLQELVRKLPLRDV